jgi:hypothetical protein
VKLLVGLVTLLVGLVKLLVGLVKPVVAGLELAPAKPAEPEPDAVETSPPGDASLAVVGVSPAVEPVTGLEPAEPEPAEPAPAVPDAVGLFAKPDVTGLVAPGDAGAPAAGLPAVPAVPPVAALATVPAVGAPVDIWIMGTGPVEKVPDPVAVTPLPPLTLYVSW